MLARTEQVKYRGLSEQPNDIRLVTTSCNMKVITGTSLINVNKTAVLLLNGQL